MKITKRGNELLKAYKKFHKFADDEMKLLIILDMGENNPNKLYYEDAIKSLKKQGYIE